MPKARFHAARARFASLAVIPGIAVAGVMVLSGGQALASQVSCGDTITADITLHRNLVNCPNNGIIIGADNVTLDLNYHRIDGDGAPAVGCDPETEFCDFGVLDNGHDSVTVTNGSVSEFALGVSVLGARKNRVLNVSSTRHVLFGLVVVDSTRSVVENGSFSRNIPPEGDGIGVFGSNHIRIVHTKIRHNPGPGIHVDHSNENLIKRNVFSRNSPGILLEKADRNVVKRNRVSRSASGIGIEGNRNVIRRNRINRSRGHEEGFGIPLAGGDHNLIARNSIRDTEGFAISVGFEPGAGNVVRRNRIRGAGELAGPSAARRPQSGVLVDSRGKRTLVLGNVIRGGAEDGVHIHAKAKHTRLKGNHAFGAKDDGIDVNNPKTKLTRNEARRNGDFGIRAVRGVIDGGGNIARHNGDPRQCTHIVCG
jgi:parallel beta-helix repeat protein